MAQKEKTKEKLKVAVRDTQGLLLEELELEADVFDGVVKKNTLYQVIVGYRANQRRGRAATKTRGEVSGGGKKPWRQKGTGRARHGSIRSPLWRHGGVVFGPHPREFGYRLPVKIRQEALRSGLNAKLAAGQVILLDKIQLAGPKTKEFAKLLGSLEVTGVNTLCILDGISDNVRRSTKNIPDLRVVDSFSVNALDILNSKKIILTVDSLKNLTKRLKNA